MGTVSTTLPSDGSTIDAADVNTPINAILSEFNGNIDNDNIKSAASISGSKIADASITNAKLQNGLIKNRQGGTTGDNAWSTVGTSNTDTSAKSVFIQTGALAVNANPTTVTFPTAFNQVPIVMATIATASSANAFVICTARTATTASFRCVNDGGTVVTTESINWVAIGQ